MESVKKVRTNSGSIEVRDDVEGEDSDSTDEQDSENSGSESSIDPTMEFKVEFEARSINPDDFLGIRRLFQQLFLKAAIDLSGLTELAIAKSSLYGSTVKVAVGDDPADENGGGDGDGNDVCGFTTFIPLTPNEEHCCVQQLKEHILSQCKHHSSSNLEQLSTLLSDAGKPIGFLVCERLLNLPDQIGSLLLQSLLKELSENLPAASSCPLVLVVARSHVQGSADGGQKRKASSHLQREKQTFDYIESEFMLQECLMSFNYPVSLESDHVFGGTWSLEDPNMKPLRTVMLLPYSKLKNVTTMLEKVLQDV